MRGGKCFQCAAHSHIGSHPACNDQRRDFACASQRAGCAVDDAVDGCLLEGGGDIGIGVCSGAFDRLRLSGIFALIKTNLRSS